MPDRTNEQDLLLLIGRLAQSVDDLKTQVETLTTKVDLLTSSANLGKGLIALLKMGTMLTTIGGGIFALFHYGAKILARGP